MTTIGQLVLSGLLIGGIYALMSIGLTLIFGVLRIVNFAHGEFLMIAMYGAWAMTRYLGLNPYYAIVAIVPAMFLFGIVVHRLIVMPALDKPHLVVVFQVPGDRVRPGVQPLFGQLFTDPDDQLHRRGVDGGR